MMPTAEDIRAALAEIHDPCSLRAGKPMNIVAMGLIGDLTVTDGRVRITLVLTEAACWFSRDIIDFVSDKVRSLGFADVEVSLDTEEIWTPDRMTMPFMTAKPRLAAST